MWGKKKNRSGKTELEADRGIRYDIALLYLEQVDYDIEAAIEAYKEDERWEKEHPLEGSGKGIYTTRPRQSVGKRRFTGQKP